MGTTRSAARSGRYAATLYTASTSAKNTTVSRWWASSSGSVSTSATAHVRNGHRRLPTREAHTTIVAIHPHHVSEWKRWTSASSTSMRVTSTSTAVATIPAATAASHPWARMSRRRACRGSIGAP